MAHGEGHQLGQWGQQGGMLGESTGPVDSTPSDDPVGGNRKCTEHGVPAQGAECSSAVTKRTEEAIFLRP
jgi:hypothetical protein